MVVGLWRQISPGPGDPTEPASTKGSSPGWKLPSDSSYLHLPERALDPHPPGPPMPSSSRSRGQRQVPKAERRILSRCHPGGPGRSSASRVAEPPLPSSRPALTPELRLVGPQVRARPRPLHAIGQPVRVPPALPGDSGTQAPPTARAPGGARTWSGCVYRAWAVCAELTPVSCEWPPGPRAGSRASTARASASRSPALRPLVRTSGLPRSRHLEGQLQLFLPQTLPRSGESDSLARSPQPLSQSHTGHSH